MKTSPAGLALIKRFEGCRLKAYRCPAGVLTVGFGHTSAAGAPAVTAGLRITQAEADAILVRDLAKYEAPVLRAVKRPLTQGQFDALVSLCYNIGPGNLAKSSVVRLLNAGDVQGAAKAFMSWTKATVKGQRVTLPGLVTRRKAEVALFASKAAPVAKAAPQPSPMPAPVRQPEPAPVTPAPAKPGLLARLFGRRAA